MYISGACLATRIYGVAAYERQLYRLAKGLVIRLKVTLYFYVQQNLGTNVAFRKLQPIKGRYVPICNATDTGPARLPPRSPLAPRYSGAAHLAHPARATGGRRGERGGEGAHM